jgi:hypothetical protein
LRDARQLVLIACRKCANTRSNHRARRNFKMKRAASMLLLLTLTTTQASADEWVRFDRPFTYQDVSRAIAYCRMLPRIHPDVGLFIDLVQGQEIQKCMYSMGWVGMAR